MRPDASSAKGGRQRPARKPRGSEPAKLPLTGSLAWWDPRWKVGRVLGDDGQEHDIDMAAFGHDGLAKAKAGMRIRFAVAPSPALGARAISARPDPAS